MENLLPLIIQLVSGGAGGIGAGKLMKKNSLGTIIDAIVGIIGGGLGGQILGLLNIGTGSGGMDIGSIIGDIASGGVGGGVLLLIVALIKKALVKK